MPTLMPTGVSSSNAASSDVGQRHRLSWRLRDAAQDLVDERQALEFVSQHPEQQPLKPLCSIRFDTQAAMERLTRDKHQLPRIFDIAAETVVKAILEDQPPPARDWDQSTPDEIQQLLQELPRALLDHHYQINVVRIQSFQRSHDNKEYTKRKGGMVDPRVDVVRTAATTTAAPPAATLSSFIAQPPPRSSTTINIKKVSKKKAAAKTTATAATKPAAAPVASTKTAAAASTAPKFTRNTPASSAAALDFRFNSSRAILCAAGNLAMGALTPGPELDVLNVPQNTTTVASQPQQAALSDASSTGNTTGAATSSSTVNMGAVVLEAQTLGQRTISVVENAIRRAALRYQFRKDNARFNRLSMHQVDEDDDNSSSSTGNVVFLPVVNPFDWNHRRMAAATVSDDDEDDGNMPQQEDAAIPHQPNPAAQTPHWHSQCLPRFLQVLEKGAGHAVYHDLDWSSRHGRLAHLLRSMASKDDDNMGPHLIVTTQPEVVRFTQEFYDLNGHLGLITTNESKQLRALAYQGTPKQRCKLRRYFPQATGLPDAPFHILITSYTNFLQDYLHFCQLPFETVLIDDGLGWMASAQGDQNSSLRNIWDTALFSANDQHVGLAGTSFKEWDYSLDTFPDAVAKEAWVGLTARHRIVTASCFVTQQRTNREVVSVSCLVSFLAPHFADVVREEWDRSRIASDAKSMNHFRNLVARSTIVHTRRSNGASDAGADLQQDMHALAVDALTGKLGPANRALDPQVPRVVPDEEFVSSGKVASSRRWTLAWLGAPDQAWMRYELGSAKLEPILDVMKLSNNHGHFCEEITTASSTTSSGASGQVAGTLAYRLAVRCGRHFGSEQGLRQHISALHAPPGTWLCRTCGTDCATSQARTHHERSCGQPATGAMEGDVGGSGGATPVVGQGGGPKSGVGKKKKGGRTGASQQGATVPVEKDPDGSFRVPGYRGVWINTAGKHFVKIDGTRFAETEGSDDVLLFDSVDDAARKYDDVVKKKKKKKNQKSELNFKPDGSRIVYEDITPASTSGLGGSAANVVPALSVINIKDLPADVKPLLRDPRQTSRTGGNSKRHVYAYRGVCRQARKGHDRWQSQISFMGQNHYLGTFDSEWDAAAVYAWAHLILYGEEATQKAQKEGEEAAAAYEQEKRDIAEGKILEPTPKPEKKKKPPVKKADKKKDKDAKGSDSKGAADTDATTHVVEKPAPQKKRKIKTATPSTSEKKPRVTSEKKGKSVLSTKAAKQKEAIAPILAKGVAKAPILSRRDMFENVSDYHLLRAAAHKMMASRENGYIGLVPSATSPADEYLRPCLPVKATGEARIMGLAILLGISPTSSGWDLQGFVEDSQLGSEHDTITALQLLAVEYDEDGVNEKFTSIMQGTVCVIGCAERKTQQAYQDLGLGTVPLGGAVGKIDCHIGGVPGSCSEVSACIRYAPTGDSDFQFACMAYDDIVTVNGKRITPEEGSVPLRNGDVCSVGARVFSFIVAVDSN